MPNLNVRVRSINDCNESEQSMKSLLSVQSLMYIESPIDQKLPYWAYDIVMNLSQICLPVLVIGPYVTIYLVVYIPLGGFGLITIFYMIPTTFILGSIASMLVIKLFQLMFF